ncbi:hypothetical protein BAE44_0005623 [Dichanthelium oligosanthes]|uniref:SprT-like domain-containing protein n=1 Tax=Dichanthelium oligosanthes TaxID=888268 RepID=A0A1E5W7Q1_9POAL|nr:hypothetical protein BAE44_0005623 [Dichanthelium oligosanthes]
MGNRLAEADLADPNPDVRDLFLHYDRLYFQGALAEAGFAVKWGYLLSSSSFGSCTFSKPPNTITLSEPVLRYLSCADRKNALLHEMIHAIIYIKHHRKNSSQHGPLFRAWMDAINSCSIQDHQRPDGGYNITTRHDFSPEEPRNFKGILWECESCGDTLLRATNQGPPSNACCIENVDIGASCGNMLCHWHNHKNDCSGTYEKTMLELGAPSQKKVPGEPFDPYHSSKVMLPYELTPYSLQVRNTKAAKPNAEDKHLSLVSGSNGKPQGSSSLKKARTRHRPEVVLETSVLLAESPRKSKGKQDLVAAEGDLFSLVGWVSPKAQACSQLADPQKRLKQDLVAPKKEELSPAMGCSDEKLLDRSSSKKALRQYEPEDIRKTTVLPAAPGSKRKASGFVASEKQRKGKCKRKAVREKEYAVMSAWLDYYESDRSSGSIEPLVNKRTERRRRERERARILTYSRSKKINPAALVNSRTDASVSSLRIKLPHKHESMQQSRPPPPCSDTAVLPTANQVVATQATGGHSQPSAPCLDVVPLQPADPPGLTPDQSTAPNIIDISDDD